MRIMLLVAGGILLTSLLAGLSAVLPYYLSSRANIEDVTRMIIQAQADALHHQLSRYQDTARQFTSRSEIRRQLEAYVRDEISLVELQDYTAPRLADAMRQVPDVVGLVRQDMAGTDITRIGLAPEKPVPGMSRVPGYPCKFLTLDDGTMLLQACAAILDDQGVQIGQDQVFFRVDPLMNLLRLDTRLSDGSLVWLSDNNGHQVMVGDAQQPILDDAETAARNMVNTPRLIPFNAPLNDSGWHLQAVIPGDQLHQQSLRLQALPVAAILVLAIIGTLLVHRLIRPLLRRARDQARALEESEHQLQQAASVFRHAREAILITDAQNTIIEVNPMFCSLLGYDADALISLPISHLLVQHEHLETGIRSVLHALDEKDAWQGEVRYRCANGTTLVALQTISPVHDAQGNLIRYIHIFNDITDQKREEEHIRHQALHDELTGLPNRAYLDHHLQLTLNRRRQADGERFALLFLDLDRFKQVNDSLGHQAGDLLLQQTSQRLSQNLRRDDLLARLGGDEFILLLDPLQHRDNAAKVAAHIRDILNAPFQINEHVAHIGVSIGIAIYPEHGSTAEELLKAADAAMYAAKKAGRNNWHFAHRTEDCPAPPA